MPVKEVNLVFFFLISSSLAFLSTLQNLVKYSRLLERINIFHSAQEEWFPYLYFMLLLLFFITFP